MQVLFGAPVEENFLAGTPRCKISKQGKIHACNTSTAVIQDASRILKITTRFHPPRMFHTKVKSNMWGMHLVSVNVKDSTRQGGTSNLTRPTINSGQKF